MTVFDAFKQIDYDYLTISRGNVYGNRIVESTPLRGIFKLRSGMTQDDNRELSQSDATLHAHPEDFVDVDEIVGNGVSYDGESYQIVGVTAGKNFETNLVEHLTFTLEKANYVDSISA